LQAASSATPILIGSPKNLKLGSGLRDPTVQIADSNFVLRYPLKDIADQFARARRVLESETVYIPFEVMAEVVYVLQSVYGVADAEIATALSSLLNYPNISTSDRAVAMYALDRLALV